MSNNGGSNINAFLVGIIVGGVLGILYAPDKGENTRRKIKKGCKEWSRKALDVAEELGSEAEPYAEGAIEAIAPVIQQIAPTPLSGAGVAGEGVEEAAHQPGLPKAGQDRVEAPEQDDLPGTKCDLGGAVNRVRAAAKKRIRRSRPQFFRGV